MFYDTIDGRARKRITNELPRRVFLAHDGYVFSNKGIVYNDYYNCTVLETVEEWGNDVNDSTEFVKISKKPSQYLNGLSVSLLSIGAVYNYAHFLFDSITRLALFENLPKQPDWILVSGPKQPWKEKILDHLGLTQRVVWINESDEVRCEQLLFTSRINFSRHISPFSVKAIRQLFLPVDHHMTAKPAPHRIIFASRKSAKDRLNKFEDMLHKVLPACFEIVDFEQLTMTETIRLCGECKCFFGVHGAAFSNLVFCQPGIKVVEFQVEEILPDWHRNYYQTLGEALNLAHRIHLLNLSMDEKEVKRILTSTMDWAQS